MNIDDTYKAIDSSRLSNDEFDALTSHFRSGRTPVEAQSKLANSAEVLRANIEAITAERAKDAATIKDLTEKLAASQAAAAAKAVA